MTTPFQIDTSSQSPAMKKLIVSFLILSVVLKTENKKLYRLCEVYYQPELLQLVGCDTLHNSFLLYDKQISILTKMSTKVMRGSSIHTNLVPQS
jgi:hypothetical protein